LFSLLIGGNYTTGQFAIVGILLILIDFIPLAWGLGRSKGNFQSKFIKIAVPIWLMMLVLGIIYNTITPIEGFGTNF
jgi:uncharacterized membrane protein YozB (DUF420 family)